MNNQKALSLLQDDCKVFRLSHCRNQDSQDLGIFKMEIPNPANPLGSVVKLSCSESNRPVSVIPANAGIQSPLPRRTIKLRKSLDSCFRRNDEVF